MVHFRRFVILSLSCLLVVYLTVTYFIPNTQDFSRSTAFNAHSQRLLSKVTDPRFLTLVPELNEKQCSNSSNDQFIEMSQEWSKNLLNSGLLLKEESTRAKLGLAVNGYISCETAYEITKAVAERLLVEALDAKLAASSR